MSSHVPASPRQTIRVLRQDMLEANDGKIERIMAMLDELADPSAMQSMLDPLRGRLSRLRPARPLRFTRLLFTPFDRLIAPPHNWRPGDPSVPRTALASIAKTVKAGLPDEAAAAEAMGSMGHK